MFENVIRFVAKVDDKVSHWFLENGTSIEVAEKMALQFIQYLAQIKVAQAAQQEQPPIPPAEYSKVQEMPSDQPPKSE